MNAGRRRATNHGSWDHYVLAEETPPGICYIDNINVSCPHVYVKSCSLVLIKSVDLRVSLLVAINLLYTHCTNNMHTLAGGRRLVPLSIQFNLVDYSWIMVYCISVYPPPFSLILPLSSHHPPSHTHTFQCIIQLYSSHLNHTLFLCTSTIF